MTSQTKLRKDIAAILAEGYRHPNGQQKQNLMHSMVALAEEESETSSELSSLPYRKLHKGSKKPDCAHEYHLVGPKYSKHLDITTIFESYTHLLFFEQIKCLQSSCQQNGNNRKEGGMGETNLAKKVASKTGRSSLGSSVTLIVMNPPCIKSDVIAHIENRDPIDYAEYISEYELMDEDPFRGDMALIVPIYLNGLNESFIGKTKNDLAKAIDIGTVRVVLPSITKTETISDDLFFDINAWTNERARRISKMLSTTDNTLITAA